MQFIRHDTLGFEYIDQSRNFVPQVKLCIATIYRHDGKIREIKKKTVINANIICLLPQNCLPTLFVSQNGKEMCKLRS